MGNRVIGNDFCTYHVLKPANPRNVQEIIERHEGRCPSGQIYDRADAHRELKKNGYKLKCTKTWQGITNIDNGGTWTVSKA